jgi:hypothetical protein
MIRQLVQFLQHTAIFECHRTMAVTSPMKRHDQIEDGPGWGLMNVNDIVARGTPMNAVIILRALSALIGFTLGTSFSWFSIVMSGMVLAAISAATLQIQGFGAVWGIAIVVACLTVNQLAYLAGACLLFQKPTDKKPSRLRNNDIAGDYHQEQKYPSRFF